MGDFYLRITLAVLVILVLPLGTLFWWSARKDRQKTREQVDALAALVAPMGGRIAGREAGAPPSAQLVPPFEHIAYGLLNRLARVRRPRWDLAVDFQRGSWRVRVSEASMVKENATNRRTHHEHRIEVFTAQLPPTKICRRLHTDFLGRPLAPDTPLTQGAAAGRAPVTVAQRQGQWLRARLPAPADHEFAVFGADLSAAARMLNPQALEHLVTHAATLPHLLTFEGGLLYATEPSRIDPGTLMPTVDVLLGLLDRIPYARP